MNQDAEHLRLLSIFHYVVAGAAAFCSFFPLIYTAVGFVFVALSRHPPTNPSQQPPPAALGWALVGVGIFLFLLGAVFALVLAFAGIECVFIPLGTILGVFTIIVLSRESVKTLFSTETMQAPH